MTFHVLYNDCHLEADMEGERRGKRGVAEQQWDERGEMEGEAEKEGAKKATISAGKLWPHGPKLNTFPSGSSPRETQSESVFVFSPVCPPSSATLHSFAIDVKPNSFKVDYTMNCAARAAIFYLQGWAGPAQRPVPRAVTWTSSWLSFTPSSLMRPDSRNWS